MSKSKSFFKKTCMFTNTALKKAQNLIEISQLNLKVAKLKSKAERKCALVGALIVAKKNGCLKKLSVEQCDEKVDKLCKDVEKLKQKIKKVRAEIKEIKHHMHSCNFCDDGFDDDDFEDCEDCEREDSKGQKSSQESENDDSYDYENYSDFEK